MKRAFATAVLRSPVTSSSQRKTGKSFAYHDLPYFPTVSLFRVQFSTGFRLQLSILSIVYSQPPSNALDHTLPLLCASSWPSGTNRTLPMLQQDPNLYPRDRNDPGIITELQPLLAAPWFTPYISSFSPLYLLQRPIVTMSRLP